MMLLTVTACAPISKNPSPNLSFCDAYTPVPTLDGGTKEQRDNIDMNNAVYLEKCL